jgi:hypothetical protein
VVVNKKIKQLLLNFRLYYPLLYLRTMPNIIKWIYTSTLSKPPHSVKMLIIRAYIKRYNLIRFVETGTYEGDTLEYIARTGIDCVSIELDKHLFLLAEQRFKKYKNVSLIYGDSGQKLVEILQTIDEPALFWLDSHQMFGRDGHQIIMGVRGEFVTPINLELKAILEHRIKNHVILIDDARLFKGQGDYPHLEDVLRTVQSNNNYSIEISTDIIRLVPR